MNKNLTITKEKNKGGRPPIILTEEQKKKVKQMASICTTQQIADYLGISRPVFFDILNRDEEVSILYKKGRVEGHNIVAGKLMDKIQNGDVTAMIFYLKTQSKWSNDKDEEIKDNNLHITVEIKKHENLDKLTPYQIQKLKDKGSL
jgi:hypothetical protein